MLLLKILILVCFEGVFTFSIFGYETKDSVKKTVEYNPDEYLDVPQIIARHGYRSESHVVQTEDGYLLTLHRIPGNKSGQKGKPIFLQHGLLGSSADWLINGNNSLGFLLADNKYDVWLGNARGNTYSKAHIHLSKDDAQFWNFSWHEMGTKDLPTYFSHILNTTGYKNLTYIGHSMGTTMFFVLSSTAPELVQHIDKMIALAPVAYMTHVESPIKYLAPFSNDIEWLAKYVGVNQFLPNNKMLKFLAWGCYILRIEKDICENVIFVISGFDKAELNQDILPVIFAKAPAGTSTKTVVHYAQEIKHDGAFQRFDYGKAENLIYYGDVTPPKYNLTNVDRPIHVFYGENDWLASPPDVELLTKDLKNLAGVYKVPMASFNHIDFLFGKNAEKLIYQPVLKILNGTTV